MTIRIYVDGEPTAHSDPEKHDIAVLSGGANLHKNAVYMPILALQNTDDKEFHRSPVGKPARERPIDVLYRSSNCTPRREALAGELRRALEAEGLRFVATGSCVAGGRRDTSYSNEPSWGVCAECDLAKMMVSFENYTGDHQYLSEKPFIAWAHGSVPLYDGNGQKLMKEIGVQKDSLLDTQSFSSDKAFVEHVVQLAKHPERLEPLRRVDPLAPGRDLGDLEPVRKLASRRGLPRLARDARVYIDNPHTPLWREVARSLGAADFRREGDPGRADLVVRTCCGFKERNT